MSQILIVEDDADSRYLLEELLTSKGHSVIAAENGEDALRLARQDPPEVIISDIMMPVMNGFRLCREVKSDAGLRNIPFIFYTATFLDKAHEKLAMSLGASRFIVKPTEGEQFIRIFDDVMDEHRQEILQVPERPLEGEDTLLEMYDNSIACKLAETVEKLQNERKSLIKSEQRLKEAQEIAQIGHWELDVKSNSFEWSDEVYRILGIKPQEFEASYETFMGFVHPDDRAYVAKVHKESFSKKTQFDIEFRVLLKDGTIKYVNERSQTLYDDDSMPAHLIGTAQDITERNQAEERLHESEERYRILFEKALEGICIADVKTGTIIDCNQALATLVGRQREELIGQHQKILHPPFCNNSLLSPTFRQHLTEKEGQIIETQVVTSKGTTREVEIKANFLNLRGRKALQGVFHDVTERKEGEKALKEAYEIINKSSVVAFTWRNQEGRPVKFVSENVERLFGYTAEEFITGKINYDQCIHQEDLKRVAEEVEKYDSNAEITEFLHMPYRIIAKDGSEKIISDWTYIVRDDQGRNIYHKGIVEDITERTHAEMEIKESEEKYRLLFDHSTDAILLTEPDGSILEANASACKMFGRSVEEIRKIGRSGLVDVTDPRLQAALDERAGKRSGTAEITMLRASGEKFPAEISSTLFVDKNGRQKTSMIIRDISERKQAEEDLRHERDLMARMMETSPVCITMVNSEGQITFANPGAEEVLGLSPDEVTDRAYNSPEWRITDYDGKPFPDEQLPFRQVMDTGLPTYDVRHAIEWPDGRRLLLSINGAPLLDKAGKIEGMICAIQDVTEQIETSKALKESESLYRLHFENVSDIIYWVNRELKVINISPSVKTVLGYKPEELIGKPFQELNLLVPEYLEKAATDTMLVFDGKRIPATEYQFLTRDGTKKWGEVSGAPLIKDGQVVAVISVARDITDRKRAEQKIKDYAGNLEAMVEERTKDLNRALYDSEESREKIDGILKSIADGLIVTDLYNRVILMNRAAETLLGARFSEVIDRPIDFAIKDGALRDRIKNTLDKKTEGYEFDFELPEEDSEHFQIIRGRTSLITDKTGAHKGIITIMHDVTYEREVDRMKTEFISTAAHELRTPLTSIQGFSELLTTRDDLTEEEKKECISYINAQSINLANIINDLLDISHIESGKGFSLNKAPCNIAELIRETVPSFKVLSKKHQFDLILPEEPIEVMGDIDKLRQVLENILSNAIKYSPEGGAIRLEAKAIAEWGLRNGEWMGKAEFGMRNEELEEMEKRPAIEVAISDKGMGMSPKQVERIFDKFYRADYSNTAIPGTGLGMSIVKYLVEAHGGEVWVESTKGKGTIVRFTIPFKTTKQTRKE